MIRFAVGDVAVRSVTDMEVFEIPLAAIFPQAAPERLAPHLPWLAPLHVDPAGTITRLACHAMLLRVDGRHVLVDTCVGCHKPRPNRPDWDQRTDMRFLDGLRACGVPPERIDFVFCTHLHVDHVGWNTRREDGRWVPTFPNARYLVGRRELAHWQAMAGAAPPPNHGSWDDSVQPVLDAGLFDVVEDGHALAQGVELRPLAGHTPGHMGLFVARGGDRAVFCGDAIHSPLQIVEPALSSAYCTNPDQAARTRTTLLETFADTGGLLVPAHFRGSGRVRVVTRAGGFFPEFAADAHG